MTLVGIAVAVSGCSCSNMFGPADTSVIPVNKTTYVIRISGGNGSSGMYVAAQVAFAHHYQYFEVIGKTTKTHTATYQATDVASSHHYDHDADDHHHRHHGSHTHHHHHPFNRQEPTSHTETEYYTTCVYYLSITCLSQAKGHGWHIGGIYNVGNILRAHK